MVKWAAFPQGHGISVSIIHGIYTICFIDAINFSFTNELISNLEIKNINVQNRDLTNMHIDKKKYNQHITGQHVGK